ncbi:MAG: hypothetical protein E5W67_00070, partial [Mesorhizobium sp.]
MSSHTCSRCPRSKQGGDRPAFSFSPIITVAGLEPMTKLPISPLEGEMPGRAEGGAVPPTCQPIFSRVLKLLPVGMDTVDSWRSFPPPSVLPDIS